MKSTRRNFFKVAGVATAGLFTGINSVLASLISPLGRGCYDLRGMTVVETSERTMWHCMMFENCRYDFFELMTLNIYIHVIQ